MIQISVNIAIFPEKSEKLDVFDALELCYSVKHIVQLQHF